jgi:hypothetical protein
MKVVLMLGILFAFNAFGQETGHLSGSGESENTENGIIAVGQLHDQAQSLIKVYPNPSAGDVYISGAEGGTLTVYSISGIYIGNWPIGVEPVVLSDLLPGTYLIHAKEGEITTSHRFVKL